MPDEIQREIGAGEEQEGDLGRGEQGHLHEVDHGGRSRADADQRERAREHRQAQDQLQAQPEPASGDGQRGQRQRRRRRGRPLLHRRRPGDGRLLIRSPTAMPPTELVWVDKYIVENGMLIVL